MNDKSQSVRVFAQIDLATKETAQQVLADIGLDLNTAIALFLKQIARDQRLPFTPDANDPFDRATDLTLADVKENRMKTFDSLDAFRKDLYSDRD